MHCAMYLLAWASLLGLSSTIFANPLPQPQQGNEPITVTVTATTTVTVTVSSATVISSRSTALATASRASGIASSAPVATGAYGLIPFGVYYNDIAEGKRIHPYQRRDLCFVTVNDTIIEGGFVEVSRCVNNTAPLPVQRNLFNLTALSTNATYIGAISPVNHTDLCLSSNWTQPVPGIPNTNHTNLVLDKLLSLQKCIPNDARQVWRFGVDERVTNGAGKAYKLSLYNQTRCVTALAGTGPNARRVPQRELQILPCVGNSPYQIFFVENGTSTPTESISGLPRPT